MSTKVINPSTKSNLANEIKPFIKQFSEEYRITHCLFSQFTAHQLLDIYTSWNWRLADKAETVDKKMVSFITSMVKCTFSVVAILERWAISDGFSLKDNIEVFYDMELKGAMMIDKFVIEYLDNESRCDEFMKCAALTRQMMFNAYLVREKDTIPTYEI